MPITFDGTHGEVEPDPTVLSEITRILRQIGRPIDDPHQMSFAFGETLAHVNYLVRKQALAIRSNKDGAWRIVQA